MIGSAAWTTMWLTGNVRHRLGECSASTMCSFHRLEKVCLCLLFIFILFLKILFIYTWEIQREREREAETQAEGEAGSRQEAWCGTQSRVSRITPWAEGGAKLLSHLGCPVFFFFLNVYSPNFSNTLNHFKENFRYHFIHKHFSLYCWNKYSLKKS